MSDIIDVRVTRARSWLVREHPFFGSLAMRLRIVERDASEVDTMATDGRFLFYCQRFIDSITEAVLLFVVAHEVLHCALGHHVRRGNRDLYRWNQACDYVVNWLLKKAGFAVPEGAFLDPAYDGMNAEQVYRVLEKRDRDAAQAAQAAQQPSSQQQQPSSSPGSNDPDSDEGDDAGDQAGGSQTKGDEDQCDDDMDGGPGSGKSPTAPSESAETSDAGSSSDGVSAGGQPSGSSDGTSTPSGTDYPEAHDDPGRCGQILDAAPAYDKTALDEAADEWQVYTRQAANVARRQGEGKLPGFAEEVVSHLNTPQTNWREEFRQFIEPMSSTRDYTWSFPNRRMLALGYITPGTISDGVNHIALGIDTSASMDSEKLKKICSEAQGALDLGAVDKITLIFADTRVHRIAEYSKGETIDADCPGRGGTAFSPTFEWVNENLTDIAALIYFTDLECTDFGPEPPYPVLWAAYGHNPIETKRLMDSVPFGRCVELVD